MNHDVDFDMAYMDTCGSITSVMIHGFALSNSMWAPQFDDLYDISRVIAPDLPGHGQSDRYGKDISVTQFARLCAELLDSTGVTQPVVLCGHSMGGLIAIEFWRQFPHRVKGLVLVSTSARPDSDAELNRRRSLLGSLESDGIEGVVERVLPEYLSPQTVEGHIELVKYVRELMMQTSIQGAADAITSMIERPKTLSGLDQIAVPTLIIHGTDDQVTPVENAELLAASIPNAELYLIPETGHLPNLEAPEIFNDIMADYLENLS